MNERREQVIELTTRVAMARAQLAAARAQLDGLEQELDAGNGTTRRNREVRRVRSRRAGG